MEVAEGTLETCVRWHSLFVNNKCMYIQYTTRKSLFGNKQIITFIFIAKWNKFFTWYRKLFNLGYKEAGLLSGEVSELHFRSSWFEFQSDLEHVLEFITK